MPEDDGWECRLRPITTQLLHRLNSTMQTRIAEVLGPLAEEWAGGLKLRSALFKKHFLQTNFCLLSEERRRSKNCKSCCCLGGKGGDIHRLTFPLVSSPP